MCETEDGPSRVCHGLWNTADKTCCVTKPNSLLLLLRSDDNDKDDEAGSPSSRYFPRESSTPTLTIQNPNEAAAHKGGD